jgi:hypothetical protein
MSARHRSTIEQAEVRLKREIAHIDMDDATLASFIASRVAVGASATTINRSLEVVRAILNRAARSYRDADGTPWLTGIPPLITMLPVSRRPPYPITWDEQDRLFPRLPAHVHESFKTSATTW